MKATLIRHAYTPEATLGYLYVGNLRLATLEEPWIPDPDGPGGQRRELGKHESCVPDGSYRLRPHSGRFPNVWALVNPTLGVFYSERDRAAAAWGRSTILLHNGNKLENTVGCVLAGLRHARVDGEPFVYESMKAIQQLRELLGVTDNELEIRPTKGTAELP